MDGLRFDAYQVDLRTGELRKHGRKIRLAGRPFQILALLLEQPGELLTRKELQERLWPADTFVDFEHGVNAAIQTLRRALSDSHKNPRYIETLPRRGYRFIAPVERIASRSCDSDLPLPRRRCRARVANASRRHVAGIKPRRTSSHDPRRRRPQLRAAPDLRRSSRRNVHLRSDPGRASNLHDGSRRETPAGKLRNARANPRRRQRHPRLPSPHPGRPIRRRKSLRPPRLPGRPLLTPCPTTSTKRANRQDSYGVRERAPAFSSARRASPAVLAPLERNPRLTLLARSRKISAEQTNDRHH